MIEKKFHIPSIILAAIAVLLEFFSFVAEGLLVAIAALVYCAKKKETHRTKLGVVLSIIAIILAAATFSIFMFILSRTGQGLIESGYWLFDLIAR